MKIAATGRRNPASQGSEVWFGVLERCDGSVVGSHEFDLGPGWRMRWRGGRFDVFFSDDARGAGAEAGVHPELGWSAENAGAVAPMRLRLGRHPWSGIARVMWGGHARDFDLYSPNEGDGLWIDLVPGEIPRCAGDPDVDLDVGPDGDHFAGSTRSERGLVIRATGLGKRFITYRRPSDRLMEILKPHRPRRSREDWALRDVTIGLRRGESLGIIGRNGAGKSTFLRLVAGLLRPSRGEIRTGGDVTAIFGPTSGLRPELTGFENARLAAAIAGMPPAQIEARMEEIESFADIGRFIDQPIRTYSSGMAARLAFAVAVCRRPDLLLIDEVMAVGDVSFRRKCVRRMRQLREAGTSIVLVSHSMGDIRAMCDNVLYLSHGEVISHGGPEETIGQYMIEVEAALNEENRRSADARLDKFHEASAGAGDVRRPCSRIEKIAVVDSEDRPRRSFKFGSNVGINVDVRGRRRMEGLALVIELHGPGGWMIWRHRVSLSGPDCFAVADREAGDSIQVRVRLLERLGPGQFGVSLKIERREIETRRRVIIDKVDHGASFCVEPGPSAFKRPALFPAVRFESSPADPVTVTPIEDAAGARGVSSRRAEMREA